MSRDTSAVAIAGALFVLIAVIAVMLAFGRGPVKHHGAGSAVQKCVSASPSSGR